MERYEAYVSLTFDVEDLEALSAAAWKLVAEPRRVECEGRDLFAEQGSATPEDALSVLLGRSKDLRQALAGLAASINGLTYRAEFSPPADVRRINL